MGHTPIGHPAGGADLAHLVGVEEPRLAAHPRHHVGSHAGTVTDIVADIVGGPYWGNLIKVLERGGRYTCSGAIAGPIVELDLRTFYLNDLTLIGSTVVEPHIFGDLVGYIERGEIQPVLAATFPLKDFRSAQAAFIDKKHTGNIVVLP